MKDYQKEIERRRKQLDWLYGKKGTTFPTKTYVIIFLVAIAFVSFILYFGSQYFN